MNGAAWRWMGWQDCTHCGARGAKLFYANRNTDATPRLVRGPADAELEPESTVGPGAYQDNDPNVVYVSAWTTANHSSASGGTYAYSSITNAKAKLTVSGAGSFKIRTITGPNRGKAEVLVDGAVVAATNGDTKIDGYSAAITFDQGWTYALPDAGSIPSPCA